jgi:phosphatidate cytidylyltransferase
MSELTKRIVSGMALVALFALLITVPHSLSLALVATLLYILVVEWKNFFPRSMYTPWLLAPVYPIAPFCMIIILNEQPTYHHLVVYLFGMVGACDTGSFVVGSLMGRRLIAPLVSPRKSWEGFLGGYAATLISFFCLAWLYGTHASVGFALIFTAGIALCALAGDLFESYLKRRAGIKDSGSILPGHGGLLDRFDSILFAVLLLYILKDTPMLQRYLILP